MKSPSFQSSQRGMMMIEALMAILIFSLGILGMVGVNSLAVSSQSDAQYRSDANKFATEAIQQMWVSVDRTDANSLATSLNAFQHQPGGSTCAFSGAASQSPVITSWLSSVTAAGSGLPGSTPAMQQVLVSNLPSGVNEVTVTVCWQAPGDLVARKHVMQSLIS
jgi:type IV pilus modification protein PilV